MLTESIHLEPEFSVVVAESQWMSRKQKHDELLRTIVNDHQQRKFEGEKNPIIDFLFEYYHFKPAKLLSWSPGIGVTLAGNQTSSFLSTKHFCKSKAGVYVNPCSFPMQRMVGLKWVIDLLESTQSRKPGFGCFGLHEWCMVYEKSDVRHENLPLRLTHAKIRSVVENSAVQCTHYDAFRFYSQSAKQFNRLALQRTDMATHEQPGCLHANMDLYRWAYKFHPWLASELIADTFLLALKIRETDMRASPYDVSDYSQLPAIKIENKQGKEEYAALQRDYFMRAQGLRARLISELENLKAQLVLNKEHDKTS